MNAHLCVCGIDRLNKIITITQQPHVMPFRDQEWAARFGLCFCHVNNIRKYCLHEICNAFTDLENIFPQKHMIVTAVIKIR